MEFRYRGNGFWSANRHLNGWTLVFKIMRHGDDEFTTELWVDSKHEAAGESESYVDAVNLADDMLYNWISGVDEEE